jgi:hypothetical protein
VSRAAGTAFTFCLSLVYVYQRENRKANTQVRLGGSAQLHVFVPK